MNRKYQWILLEGEKGRRNFYEEKNRRLDRNKCFYNLIYDEL